MSEETIVTEDVPVKGTIKFGISQIKNPTPKEATNFFRWFFYAAGFIGTIVTIEPAIPVHVTIIIVRYLFIATMLVHGASRLLGVDTTQIEEEADSIFKKK